jgi:hypothetical protein
MKLSSFEVVGRGNSALLRWLERSRRSWISSSYLGSFSEEWSHKSYAKCSVKASAFFALLYVHVPCNVLTGEFVSSLSSFLGVLSNLLLLVVHN